MRGRSVAGALALSSLLLAAACSSSGSSGGAANGAGAAGAGEVSSAPVANSDNNAWALRYTGGSAGPAKGTPYKIGFVSQDTFLPSATQGARAAVAYVDAELGGVGGRPIELVSCSVNVPEDAARCGAQMANDASLSLVIVGGLSVGNKEFYDAVGGRKAILIGNALASEDFVTTRGVAYTAGSPGVLMGMARFAVEELKARTVAGIVPDTPAGRAAAQQLVKPILDAAKVKFRPVFISLQATTPDLTTALQASGAGSADALITAFPPSSCISMYDAIHSLGIKPKVITTDQCADVPVRAHLKTVGAADAVPDGWYYANYGYNFDLPDVDSGMKTYQYAAAKYAKPLGSAPVELRGFSGPTFGTVMTAAKIVNQLGVDKATSFDVVDRALRGFAGPAMLQVGPLKCGQAPFVAVCGHQIGVDQYTGGKWTSVRDGLNDKPVNLLAPVS
ncbi:ABC-type branched-chain amino acid transport system, periplasmic component [Frankia torreyi]|uniref:ABC-type branched-chain amino acid transport system, periplasmic component n=2 Tax=Frankia TaxID=1854 RepID=A0A0D8BIX2_9ACTN|nr:ABC transporter substrate-binding protein [Frankia torreyi]KJE23342.1 ABC-type branched-chain amino acid transport system, periplasmic component [Frankia torreyi]KQC36463.1 hypothetical protein UK82_20690 [Frankia sp. ACN1ag]